MSKKPSIIVGMPESNGICEVILQGLADLGFEVVSICFKDSQFHYKSFSQKIQSWYQKKIIGNKQYKSYLKFLPYQKDIELRINTKDSFDYGLFIRADIYPDYILALVKSKTKKMIGYQWDGLDRYPIIFKYIRYFDSFFCFSPEDVKLYHIKGITNFFLPTTSTNPNSNSPRLIFLGSMFADRIAPLSSLKDYCMKKSIPFDIFCYQDRDNTAYYNFKQLEKPVPYLDYIKMLAAYNVIVDLAQTMHRGLSFRVFEALGANKKLITTNVSVAEYEFYHPNNIFILGENNIQNIENFLTLPFMEANPQIKAKYTINNWIYNLLGITPFSQIHLPKMIDK